MYPDSKYISLGYLQSYFVNKDFNIPLAGGIVTFYSDNERSKLKPIYQLNGAPGAYNFTLLPNPLVLSPVGTFIDENGNEIVPYAYPYDSKEDLELYYITVTDRFHIEQYVRQAVPSDIAEVQQEIGSAFNNNYIKNGQFAVINSDIVINSIYDSGKKFINNSLFTNSPYDSGLVFYINGIEERTNIGDCFILQNSSSVNQNLSVGILDNDANPISELSTQEANPYYYLKYSSNSTSGEAFKYILDIAGDISAFAGNQITYSVVCNTTSSAGINLGACCIQVYYDDNGAYVDDASSRLNTGVILTNGNNVEIASGTHKISFTITVPPLNNELLTIGGGLFIVGIVLPTNDVCNINITNRQLNDSIAVVPSYPYNTLSNVQAEILRLPVQIPNASATQYHAYNDIQYKNPSNTGYIGGKFAKLGTSASLNTNALSWEKSIPPGTMVANASNNLSLNNIYTLDWLYANGSRLLSYSYGDLFRALSTNNIPTYGTGSTFQSSGLTNNIFTVSSNEFGGGRAQTCSSEFSISVNTPGTDSTVFSFKLICPAASAINPVGSFITLQTAAGTTHNLNIYFVIDGFVDPNLSPTTVDNKTTTFVYLSKNATANQVAQTLYKVFDPLTFLVPNLFLNARYYLIKT